MQSIKAALFSIFLLTTSSLLAATATTAKEDPSQKSITTVPDNLVWQKVEGLPGVKRAILYGDPNKAGPFTIRLKFPANYQVLAHTHPGLEQDTVISGSLYLGVGKHFDEKKGMKLVAGSFVAIPAGVPHFGWTNEETVLQITGVGPWKINYMSVIGK